MTRFAFCSLFTILFCTSFSFASPFQEAPIGEFHQVTEGVVRGARPSLEGLQYLAQIGVKTILNLENDPQQVAWETEQASKLGMRMISTPMSGFWKPKTDQVNRSLSILADPSVYPLFVHCQHGQDRTGLIVGLYRVFHEAWDPTTAYNEMLENGFHPILLGLNDYYSEKTGYQHLAPKNSVYQP